MRAFVALRSDIYLSVCGGKGVATSIWIVSGEEASSALSSNALVLRTDIFSVLSKCHEKKEKKRKKKANKQQTNMKELF